MDISVMMGPGKFNFRVAGIFLHDNKMFVMNDERGSYDYLPGGRVKLNESVEDAIKREIKEELDFVPEIERPLWFNQSFFTEQMSKVDYHELCIYFLLKTPQQLIDRGNSFTVIEDPHTFNYKWVNVDDLKNMDFFPMFLKEEIYNLPEQLKMLTEYK